MPRKAGSHAELTGPRITEAAERLFAVHGYAAVSMRQIASEVGVQAGALYNYTPDKQSLLYELMSSHLQLLMESWLAENRSGTPTERLKTFTEFHIRYHIDRPDAVFIAYMELRNLTPANFAKIETLRRAYELELEQILRDGQADRSFVVPDLRVTTMALLAMLTGVNTWYREDGRLSRARLESVYWTMVRRMVHI
ncbi:MAG: TetR/AcrR family transcriptional regulator [Pseudomonadota bacterium]